MFILLSDLCFLCSLGITIPHLRTWEPFAMGPLFICSVICLTLLTLQVLAELRNETNLLWGQMYILWSLIHMMASLSNFSPVMLTHFLWLFSSVCWQVSYQIIYS